MATIVELVTGIVLTIFQFFQQHKWVLLVIVGVLGLLAGYSFGFYQVEPVNCPIVNLRKDFRDQYLLWVAREYELRRPTEPEWGRKALLGIDYAVEKRQKTLPDDIKQMVDVLNALATACETGEPAADNTGLYVVCNGTDAARLRILVADLQNIDVGAEDEGPGMVTIFAGLCLVILIATALAGGVFFLLRRRGAAGEEAGGAMADRLEPVDTAAWGTEGPPLAQFPTTYTLGDDHYDPSFSIELESGEFMGECGVGISETIGVGPPNKVTGFEVWLFDKSDIRTVTKVLMSEYAFNDEALRTKLAPKGEPIMAKEDGEIVLETKTLRVVARVVEASYGIGNLPPNSFFERLSVELAAWVKSVPDVEDIEYPDMAGGAEYDVG